MIQGSNFAYSLGPYFTCDSRAVYCLTGDDNIVTSDLDRSIGYKSNEESTIITESSTSDHVSTYCDPNTECLNTKERRNDMDSHIQTKIGVQDDESTPIVDDKPTKGYCHKLRKYKQVLLNFKFLLPSLLDDLKEVEDNDDSSQSLNTVLAERRIVSAIFAFGGNFVHTKKKAMQDCNRSSIFREKRNSTIIHVTKTLWDRCYERRLSFRYRDRGERLSWDVEENPPVVFFSDDEDEEEHKFRCNNPQKNCKRPKLYVQGRHLSRPVSDATLNREEKMSHRNHTDKPQGKCGMEKTNAHVAWPKYDYSKSTLQSKSYVTTLSRKIMPSTSAYGRKRKAITTAESLQSTPQNFSRSSSLVPKDPSKEKVKFISILKEEEIKHRFKYSSIPLSSTHRKRMFDLLISLRQNVPTAIDDDVTIVLEGARDKWDSAVAELITQLLIILYCPDNDTNLDGIRCYLLTIGICC